MINQQNNDIDKFERYIIFFIEPTNKKIMFLGNIADVDAVCYNENELLYGTKDIRLAKKYSSIDQAKEDIYKLRYHIRNFLKIPIGIKRILDFDTTELGNLLNK